MTGLSNFLPRFISVDTPLVPFQSTETPAAEVTFVRDVLLDIGGITLFRSVGMMFMLHQLLVFSTFPDRSSDLCCCDWPVVPAAYGST